MPYGDDSELEAREREYVRLQLLAEKEYDDVLRRRLKREFAVPDNFLDLAVRIWWDGKED